VSAVRAAGDTHCRVTVVGGSRRVELALPARAPLAEFVSSLAPLCGEPESEALPPGWSLAPVGQRPLPLSASLAGAGVVDGAVLYLRDVLEGEADEPLVLDVQEAVVEADARLVTLRWDGGRGTRAVVALGLAALWPRSWPPG
jgi:hypothetical protein